MVSRAWGRVWVGFTTSLIAFISYSVQIFVIWPWYGSTLSVDLLKLLLPFNALVGLLYYNYYLCVVTNPGEVPPGWRPAFDDDEEFEVKKYTAQPRFCRQCSQYKPPRAHHCSQCRRCVLKMDHHCPWVNNCVGFYNHAHFVRFLFFVDLACSYHLWMLTTRVFDVLNTGEPESTELVFIVLNYVTCIPVILAVGFFSLYHFYLLACNTTSIEGLEKDKVARLVKRGKIRSVKFPYSISTLHNVRSVLGHSAWQWCFPTRHVPGSGVSFPVSQGGQESAAEAWPPQDPDRTELRDHYGDEDDDAPVNLPETGPWTYANGGPNPALRASSQRLRQRHQHQAYPPYHPLYGQEPPDDDDYDDDSRGSISSDDYPLGARVRRGSEGYEVRPMSRDDILQQYVATRGEDVVGRYRTYQPQPPSEPSDPEDDSRDHAYDGGSIVV
ncbi:zf-DHHC-domain-containing protein [Exidia glandulosa HHB12029]|uniref:Palmitoyltransferase PFA4 n=1 Tax=Exidia glandulosa HHB12029 TaxID=1314781 RepID=A0A165MIH4_EXIGL|nr:zf-DHHC-domain-containing protein [Exidia glandulosa HHB12029]